MKEFTSSARIHTDDGTNLRDLPFTLDGSEYVLRAPKRAQLAFLTASSAASRSDADRVAALLDFFEAALIPPGNEMLRARLLNPNDSMELENVMDIMTWAVEEWSGRPSTSANGSSPQRSAVGRRSRAIASVEDSHRSH